MKKKPKQIKPLTANDILRQGGMSDEQILAGRLANTAEGYAIRLDTMKLFITFGVEVLQERYDFTIGESGDWTREVLKRATEYMSKVTNEQGKN